MQSIIACIISLIRQCRESKKLVPRLIDSVLIADACIKIVGFSTKIFSEFSAKAFYRVPFFQILRRRRRFRRRFYPQSGVKVSPKAAFHTFRKFWVHPKGVLNTFWKSKNIFEIFRKFGFWHRKIFVK